MPIQFACPSCAAAIRVDESAAGKKGKCPQCGRELIIPRPTSAAPQAGDSGLPAISVQEPTAARRYSSRRRKRSGSRFWSIAAPLVLFSIVVGTMVFLLRESEPTLEGKLPGEVIADFEMPPQLLAAQDLGISEEEFQSLLESVRENPPPIGMIPKQLRLVIEADTDAIRVGFEKLPQTELVRVTVDADRELYSWLLEHRAELDRIQRQAAEETLAEFVKSLQRSYDEDLPFDTASWASRLVTLFENGFGFATEAVTKTSRARCVYESDEGELHFLLPESTKTFRLEERENSPAKFPGSYTIQLESSR
ncbi:hypothetical protein [Thalassoroseus pseudoceratinae]|uniref:hypothetical protein n=1 Tax=Thalassoroseus pseudoceratinae TaxID=2713176 RepID=UPI00141FE606|nr:hypothetical protein [Thalassoroseus pseudoceratinae]